MSDATLPAPDPAPRRRGGLVVAVVVLAVVVVLGGAGFAAWRFLGTSGTQPAEALPADTLGVVSLDLDPSGGQKLEALRALRAFPALRERLGADGDRDLLRTFVEEVQSSEDACPDLDYDRDLEPWVGQRFAVAAVPGADAPEPVLVVQVEDADAAREGAKVLAACAADSGGSGGSGGGSGGYAVGGDYLVAASSTEVAQRVLDDAAEEPLSADEDYRDWTDRAGGGDAILSMYAAPEAGRALAELGGSLTGDTGEADAAADQLAEFEGAAATVRFDDGGIVLSGAAGGGQGEVTGGSVADGVGALPADTAAVLALASSDESRAQVQERLDQLDPGPADDVLGQVEGAFASVGLTFPDDLLTVLGDTFSVSLGGTVPASFSAPQEIPAGIRIDGDPDAVRDVISRAEQASGLSLTEQGLVVESDDDSVALGLDAAYAQGLLGSSGGLGEDETFTQVLPELSRSSAVLFVRFDSDWRDRLLEEASAPADVRDDVEALKALGLAAWNDDGALRFEARLSLD